MLVEPEIPDVDVLVNGAPLPFGARQDLQSVTVQEDLEAFSMFTLVLYNWDPERLRVSWSDSSLFAVGNTVEISLGYLDQQLHKVIVAEITSLEPTFTADEPPTLTVRGYDYRHRLARGRKTRSFSQMKDSAIAEQLAREAGLVPQVTDTKAPRAYVLQSNQTDHEFLQMRAELIGYEVYVSGKTLFFRPPQNAGQPAVRLSLAYDITEFTPRLSAQAQVGEVAVRGWDVKKKEVIVGRAGVGQESTTMGGAASGPRTTSRAFGRASVASVNLPVGSKAEADQIALGRFNEIALTYIEGDVACYGRAQVHAGSVVEIEGAGEAFSGPYYVSSVVHSVNEENGYQTTFTAHRNAE